MNNQLTIALHGATGKMGKTILSLMHDDAYPQKLQIVPVQKGETPWHMMHKSHDVPVWIDFSAPEAVHHFLLQSDRHHHQKGCPIVMATTGLSSETLQLLSHYSAKAPVMLAPNTSTGVALMHKVLHTAMQWLKALDLEQDCDMTLIEKHHHQKKDAPSGTALALVHTIKQVVPNHTIDVHSIRAGTLIGEHHVSLHLPFETLDIIHKAESRIVFAKGALTMAKWIQKQKNGLYTPQDLFKSCGDPFGF